MGFLKVLCKEYAFKCFVDLFSEAPPQKIGLEDKNGLMDCQGAQEEPEGRPGGPADLETAREGCPLPRLPLSGPPGLPSGSSNKLSSS